MGKLDRINRMLRWSGYGLSNLNSPSWKKTYTVDYLSLLDVDIVIDVGVASGTPIVYHSFPSAYLILVDPLPIPEDLELGHLSNRSWEYHSCALGSRPGMVEMHVDRTQSSKSSIYERSDLTRQKNHTVEIESVRVTTLDLLANEFGPDLNSGAVFLKVDTEGFEWEVIQGASDTLANVDYLLIETSFADRFESNYDPIELLWILRNRGFRVHSIADYTMDNESGKCIHSDILLHKDPRK